MALDGVGPSIARGNQKQNGNCADLPEAAMTISQDNTNIGTNYMQHTLAIDFVPQHNLVLNATYYRYRQKDGVIGPVDWQNRLRLNFLVNF